MLKKYTSPFKILASLERLPVDSANALLIYDRSIKKVPLLDKFKKKFLATYAVTGGESLKDVEVFPEHVLKISKLLSRKCCPKPIVYVLGGGSVGDFAAFFCSIYRRGLAFIHIPSTYLAAIDSAHGAKNALNVGGFKNQVGTFWPAQKVYLVKSVLDTLPEKIARESYSELFKAALLARTEAWAQKLINSPTPKSYASLIERHLKDSIFLKNKIVEMDPFESKKIRYQLNLGHTLGHAFESILSLSHGEAVAWGLRFSIDYSFFKKSISAQDHSELLKVWLKHFSYTKVSRRALKKISSIQMKKALAKDKKNLNTGVYFVYLSRTGARARLSSLRDIQKFWLVWQDVI
jgi:3-dehydroquinate synthase